NPGEAKIREGLLHSRWPAVFPSGQGSDLAGIVAETGPDVTGFAAGDEVIGFTDNRASQAEYVLVEAANLAAKPAAVPWEVAGAGRRPARWTRSSTRSATDTSSWRWSSVSRRPGWTRSPTSTPSSGMASRPRATRRGPARACSPSWRG